MSEFNIDDYELIPQTSKDNCGGCVFESDDGECLTESDIDFRGCADNVYQVFALKKPTRESLLAEIAELDRQKEIKERELRELSNKEQGNE